MIIFNCEKNDNSVCSHWR